jgi:hypothetical protein
MKPTLTEYRKAAKANPTLSMEDFVRQQTGKYPAFRAVAKNLSVAARLLHLDVAFERVMNRRAARRVAEARANGGWLMDMEKLTVRPMTQAEGDRDRAQRVDAVTRQLVKEATNG